MNRFLESPIVENTNILLMTKGGQNNIRYYIDKYPEYKNKFREITYIGYSLDEFSNIKPYTFDRYIITYAGRLYKDWICPKMFLKAFANFVKQNNISSQQIQIKFFVKGWLEEYDILIRSLDIDDYIDLSGFIKKEKLFSILKGSNLLIYINGSRKTSNTMILSKFWDYVASGTSILMLADKDFIIRELVRKYELGFVANENDFRDIQKALSEAYYKSKTKNKLKKDQINSIFSRKNHDLAFVNIITELFN
jgi:glycosyltransferase involved in cell wall biosynthesis